MDNRKYNIFFHTHTISGIFICALLFVMFFAGSFSFFKDDITAWQRNSSLVAKKDLIKKDFNGVLDSLSLHHYLKGRDISFSMQRNGMSSYITMAASQDSTVKPKEKTNKPDARRSNATGRGGNADAASFSYDFSRKKEVDYRANYDMGEFLYRLHFLAQLNAIPVRLGGPFGYLLAGLVSFLFLFALITGLMLHWNKIVSNFFTFRPWNKWKTVFTDLHTALGVIQFPFQFIFAVTGIVLITNSVLILPFAKYLYKGDTEKLYTALEYSDSSKFAYTYKPLSTAFDLNGFLEKAEKKWDGDELGLISVRNYQDENMHVIVTLRPHADQSFAGSGKIIYRVRDEKILYEVAPTVHSSYIDKVKATVYHLHFGDFGGRPLRVLYFVLGIMGCIVILSGIMIWLVARDKTNTPKYKRVFNFWTANVFLAACMPMLPVTAFTMTVLLFLKNPGQTEVYHWFFYSWLFLGIYFTARKNIAATMSQTTILSAVTCFLLPLLDGIVRNNWFWNTYTGRAYDILFIDLLFFAISMISVVVLFKLKTSRSSDLAIRTKDVQEAASTVIA